MEYIILNIDNIESISYRNGATSLLCEINIEK